MPAVDLIDLTHDAMENRQCVLCLLATESEPPGRSSAIVEFRGCHSMAIDAVDSNQYHGIDDLDGLGRVVLYKVIEWHPAELHAAPPRDEVGEIVETK